MADVEMDDEPMEAPKELNVGEEENITPDGGVKKKLLRKGEKMKRPSVHFIFVFVG